MSDVDLEQRLKVFFASAPPITRRIDVLEIGHSAMTKTYYLWREPYAGEVTTEAGVVQVLATNFQAKRAGTNLHLDQVYEIALDLVDTADEFKLQMGLVPIDTKERVRVVLREYLSDDLTDMLTRAVLQMEEISYQPGAAMLKAVQPRFNVLRTGELYVVRDVPMLRNFL